MNQQLDNLVQLIQDLGNNQGDIIQEVQDIGQHVQRAKQLRDSVSLSPSSFTGSSTIDADRWLDRFQQYCELTGYTDDQKCTTLRLLLTAGAEIWHRSLANPVKTNYIQLIAAFRAKYINLPGLTFIRETEILNRQQRDDESVEHFFAEIRSRCAALNNNEAEVRSIVLRGLKPNIRAFTLSSGVQDLDAIESKSCLAESLFKLDQKPPMTAAIVAPDTRSQVSHFMSEMTEILREHKQEMADIKSMLKNQPWQEMPRFRPNTANPPGYGQYMSNRPYNGPPMFRSAYCSYCRNNTHNTRDCTYVPPNLPPQMTCYSCGKPGHMAKHCSSQSIRNAIQKNQSAPFQSGRQWGPNSTLNV